MGLQSLDQLAAEFLAAPKAVLRQPRWRTRHHSDYAALTMAMSADGQPHLRGLVIVTSHRLILPPKLCFSLLFRRHRILGLDVNPRRFHRNLLTGQSVSITHWQQWPAMEAEPDDREHVLAVWLHEFLVRGNVTCKFRIMSPPRGMQLDLL